MLQEGFLDKIYYRFWKADNNPVANVFAVHGLGGHCLWFDKAAQLFNANDISFFSFDLPGFGQSKFPKGQISSYKIWLETTHDVLTKYLMNFFVMSPVFILGHSLGALLAILLSEKVKANGWILSVPGFEGSKQCFPFKDFILPVLMKSVFKSNENVILPFGPDVLTKNKETQTALKMDPMRVINLSADVYKHVFFLSLKAKNSPHLINAPVLMLTAGNDVVCSNEVMESFFENIQFPDKSKKSYTDSYHDLFVEDKLELVVRDVSDWIKKHLNP
jgi:alpha-beta hydrolase superfamily lysophospholipase